MNPIAALLAAQSVYLALVFVLAAIVFGFAWNYYEAVLKDGGRDRDRLLDRLARGGGPRIFYIDLMTALLDRVDALLGDAGQGQRWVARLFGLNTARPCWTGRSFDTCALLAVVYPLASLIATWLLVGDAGPIGDLFGLREQPDRWVRLATAVATGIVVFALVRRAWLAYAVAVAVAAAVAVADVFLIAFAFVFAGSIAVASAVVVGVAGAVAGVGAVAFAVAVAGAGAGAFAFAGAGAGVSAVVFAFVVAGTVAADRASARGRLGAFWVAYWPVAVAVASFGLWLGGRFGRPPTTLSLLAMIGLLPLVNLPFDWASIGVTRALLRRGCDVHGAWLLRSPTILGVLDFLLGLALLAGLAAALILSLSAADAILSDAGARPTFDAAGLIQHIRERPGNPAHGWVYFTLLSTLLPSFFNLLVGVFSLLTFSVPIVRRWLIATIPTLDEAGRGGTRWQVVFALSAQWFFGMIFTGIGLWLLWQAALMVPGAEQMALDPLHSFALWCARLFGVPSSPPPS